MAWNRALVHRSIGFAIAVVLATSTVALASTVSLGTARSAGSAGRPAGTSTAAGTITTIAGGIGGPGFVANVAVSPCAVTFAGGSLYATDLVNFAPEFSTPPSVIRRITTTTGHLTTLAGNGTDPHGALYGVTGVPQVADGSPATSAGIGTSCGVAVDRAGNVLVSDSTSFVDATMQAVPYGIRVIAMSTGVFYGRHMTQGDVYTLVNARSPRFTRNFAPGAIAVDTAGNVLFTSADNHVYALAERSGTFYGRQMTSGHIYVVAGGGSTLGDGGLATHASLAIVSDEHYSGNLDSGLRIDHHGNLLISDQNDCRVRVVAGHNGIFYGRAMRAGHIYTIAGDGNCRPFADTKGAGNGGLATKAALSFPAGIAVDHAGNVVIADGTLLRVVAESTGRFYGQAMKRGHIYRIAGNNVAFDTGNGGLASTASLSPASGVSVDGSGNLVIGTRALRVVAVRSGSFYGRRMRAGHIYAISAAAPVSSGDGEPAARAEMAIRSGTPLATDGQGDLLVADGAGREVRIIPAVSGTVFGQAMRAGSIYRIAGDGKDGPLGDGGPATSAGFGKYVSGINGIATDGSGNLLIADGLHQRVRVVAAQTGTFYGEPMSAGRVYTVAGGGTATGDGGPATQANLGLVSGVVADAHGNVLVPAEAGSGLTTHCLVRVVAAATGVFYGQSMTTGHIYTIAGDGTCTASGDGGPATSAGLESPSAITIDQAGNVLALTGSGVRVIAVANGTFYGQAMTKGDIYTVDLPTSGVSGFTVDQSGNLVFTDSSHESVVVLAEATGTFYGQAMTAGYTYQIAGDGQFGNTGDGGPATSAALLDPIGVAVTAAGDLLITNVHWIREIAG